jgi:hypothetical protein
VGVSGIGPDGGYRLPWGDGIGSRGRRRSIFVLISARQIFLSLLAGMSVATAVSARFGHTAAVAILINSFPTSGCV